MFEFDTDYFKKSGNFIAASFVPFGVLLMTYEQMFKGFFAVVFRKTHLIISFIVKGFVECDSTYKFLENYGVFVIGFVYMTFGIILRGAVEKENVKTLRKCAKVYAIECIFTTLFYALMTIIFIACCFEDSLNLADIVLYILFLGAFIVKLIFAYHLSWLAYKLRKERGGVSDDVEKSSPNLKKKFDNLKSFKETIAEETPEVPEGLMGKFGEVKDFGRDLGVSVLEEAGIPTEIEDYAEIVKTKIQELESPKF